MKKITILGSGMIGSVMAIDLCDRYQVKIADINPQSFTSLKGHPIQTIQSDLSNAANIRQCIQDTDLVINAVPGFMGYKTLHTAIEAGKNITDIAFFNQDPFSLDSLARENNIIAITDCGVAPGMSNIILGRHNADMDVESFDCMVGGLPLHPVWPYRYKAPFSPIDVLEEYTRPARIVKNGKTVIRPALSDAEIINIQPVGELEAFNTDGLRTLLKTMTIRNMKEKTLRYPGHIELMKILRETGFFRKEMIRVQDSLIRPIDLTARLLFPFWKLGQEEPELTVMKIKITGKKDGKNKTFFYSLYDEYDSGTRTSSMARTTGYICTACATLVLEGAYKQTGISPPEFIGADKSCFEKILRYQEERRINYTVEES